MTSDGIVVVSGIGSLTVGKKAYICAQLFFCQSFQILSTKAWTRKNSGAAAELSVNIVPPTPLWVLKWRPSRNKTSKSVNLSAANFKRVCRSASVGRLPKFRARQCLSTAGESSVSGAEYSRHSF